MADPVTTPVVTPVVTTPAADPAVTTPVAAAPKVTPAADSAKPTLAGETPPKAADPAKTAEAPPAFDPAKLTLPEGMKTDDPLFQRFSETLSDAKLSPQERGQKMIDLYKDATKTAQDANKAAWNKVNETWVSQVKSDPDVGGPKFEATKASIAKAIDSLGPELSVAFRQGLDVTGAGNHPAIWKGLAKMAEILTEGGHVAGNPANAKPDLATAFFPNSKMT